MQEGLRTEAGTEPSKTILFRIYLIAGGVDGAGVPGYRSPWRSPTLSGLSSLVSSSIRLYRQPGRGTVIIQDPGTAEFGEMPRSLAPSTVNIVSDLEVFSRHGAQRIAVFRFQMMVAMT
jgi:hypothetical protein